MLSAVEGEDIAEMGLNEGDGLKRQRRWHSRCILAEGDHGKTVIEPFLPQSRLE